MNERDRLVRHVWPDKRLYACTILIVGGLSGMAFDVVLWTIQPRFDKAFPQVLVDAWPSASFVLSFLAVIFAFASLRARRNLWGYVASVLGFISLGTLGVETLLALGAFAFLVASSQEGEDHGPDLHARMWPDKSLAAALLSYISAITSLVWATVLLAGIVEIGSAPVSVGLGVVGLAAAGLQAYAARRMSVQQAPGLSVLANVVSIAAFSFYLVGPVLAIAGLVLLKLAASEDEFAPAAAA